MAHPQIAGDSARAAASGRGRPRRGGFGGFIKSNDSRAQNRPYLTPPGPPPPANLAELSEKDVLDVIGIIRKDFTVDENRVYLMGHSMGGAGALFLGSKYADQWAAVAAMAPAAFRIQPNAKDILQPYEDKNVPLMIAQGDAGELVPVTSTRQWAEAMKELRMDYRYDEIPGATHGSVIEKAMPEIFAFFQAHVKK